MTMATKRPYADPTSRRRSVTINEQDWQKLKALGKGNASAGIREAVRIAENLPAPYVDLQAEADI